jgi:hypothetical protein
MTYGADPSLAEPSPSAEADAREKKERFFASIKDQIELTKGVSLGLAVIAASHPLMGSGLNNATKIVGAFVCIGLGFWTIYGAVVLFCQHRMNLLGLPVKAKLARVAQYLFLCIVCFFAGDLAFEVGKHASAGKPHFSRTSTQ